MLAAILVRLQAVFFQPRVENRFAGGSIETFAATLVRLQAEREGLDFVVAYFKNFTR